MKQSKIQEPQSTTSILGKVFLNGKLLEQVSLLEVAPVGDAIYSITLHMLLTNKAANDPRHMYRATQELSYEHPFIETRYFEASLIDSGFLDKDNALTLISFFKARAIPQSKIKIND